MGLRSFVSDTFHEFKEEAKKIGHRVADDVVDAAHSALREGDRILKEAERDASWAAEKADQAARKFEEAADHYAKKLKRMLDSNLPDLDPAAIKRQVAAQFANPLIKAVLARLRSEAAESRRQKKGKIKSFFVDFQKFDGPRRSDPLESTGLGATDAESFEKMWRPKEEIYCFNFLSATFMKVLPGPISKDSDGTNKFYSKLLRQKAKEQWVRGIVPIDFVEERMDTVDLIIKENLRKA